jgi:hypothetical protein
VQLHKYFFKNKISKRSEQQEPKRVSTTSGTHDLLLETARRLALVAAESAGGVAREFRCW